MAKHFKNKKNNPEKYLSVKDLLRQFRAEDTYLSLQSILCHPSNQKFTHRIAYLIAELLAIPANLFNDRSLNYHHLQILLQQLEPFLTERFEPIEDFTGFDQNKLVPLFWEGKPYFFFYALFDRPYESWKELIEMASSNELSEIDEFKSIQDLIRTSLTWQTRLLSHLTSLKESKEKHDTLYLPSAAFLESIIPFFTVEGDPRTTLQLGSLKSVGSQNLLDNATNMGKYLPELYIRAQFQTFFLYPQVHYEALLSKLGEAIVRNSQHLATFMHHFRHRLAKATYGFFKKGTQVYRLLTETRGEDLLRDIADYTFQVDDNKLVLFKAVTVAKGNKSTREINEIIQKIETVFGKVKKEEALGIDRHREERMLALVARYLEIYVILVYEPVEVTYTLRPRKNKAWNDTWIFSLMDLIAVLEHLDSPIEFLKFLQEEHYLITHADVLPTNAFIDRFYQYLQNGKCYLSMSYSGGLIYFPDNLWGAWYMRKLHEYFGEFYAVHAEVEQQFPGVFSAIEKYRANVYSVSEPIDFEGCYLAKLIDRFIWVYLPTDPLSLPFEDYRAGTELFGPMIADYIARMDDALVTLLKIKNISRFSVLIAATGFIKRDKEYFSFLTSYAEKINKDFPYRWITLRINSEEARSYLLIHFPFSHRIFNTPDNTGERTFLFDFLKSIAFIDGHENETETEPLRRIIDTVIPVGKKAYAVDQLEIHNPDIEHYDLPIEPTPTDIGIANRTVAIFLKEKGWQSGVYKEQEAQKLYSSIFDHLQSIIEQKVATYAEDYLIYAYQQLEMNEGRIEQRKLKAGMRVDRQLDYNLADSVKKGLFQDSVLASSIRLLLHTALKVGTAGHQTITRMDWTQLLALSHEAVRSASGYEYLQHNLLSITIHIDEHYRVTEHDEPTLLDFTAYNQQEVGQRLQQAVKSFEKATTDKQTNVPQKDLTADEQREQLIDEAFMKTYGIAYSKVLLVLYVLSKMQLPPPAAFPVYIFERSALIRGIQANLVISISDSEINHILDFLCLKEGIFPQDKFLYFGAMMRSKERITVCPLIELRNGRLIFARETIDGCLNIWSDVFHGNIPFGVEENTPVDKVMKSIRRENGIRLEQLAEGKAIEILGRKNVEGTIDNFKRLSPAFKVREECGEIDLLCVNPNLKMVFVFDCKNLIKLAGLYHAKRNVEEFYTKKNAYLKSLKRKKEFIASNLKEVLLHFNIIDPEGWQVQEAFIVTKLHYAAFYKGEKSVFVQVDELFSFLKGES